MTIYMPAESDRDNFVATCNCGSKSRYLLGHQVWCAAYAVPFTRVVEATPEELAAAHRAVKQAAAPAI